MKTRHDPVVLRKEATQKASSGFGNRLMQCICTSMSGTGTIRCTHRFQGKGSVELQDKWRQIGEVLGYPWNMML